MSTEHPDLTGDEISGDADLEAQGWTRRYLADENRAREAELLYQEAGFDVLLHKLRPDNLGPKCGHCTVTVCSSYVLVYTRERG